MTEPSKTPTLDALEALKTYPNLSAIIQGTVSGSVTEWPAIRTELVRLCGCFSEGSSKWIPVSERLPAPLTTVLAIESSGAPVEPRVLAFYNPQARTRHMLGSAWIDYAGDFIDVSHWMPLPEAPK